MSDLVQMSAADWDDVHLAALFSNGLARFLPLEQSVPLMQKELGKQLDDAIPLDTGMSVGRKGVLFRHDVDNIVIAFEATKPDEMYKNAWSHAQDSKWSIPYARYLDGRQVHSFYLDMWLGMREDTLKALSRSLDTIEILGKVPQKLIMTGHSMGGGISTLALIDIVQHIRLTYGETSTQPRPWALDHHLGSLIKHITFAEFAATGKEYNTHLNESYDRYRISAWDFVHPHDFTTRLHLPFFRAWRGHRYVLPGPAVVGFEREYAAGRHDMPGYMASVDWMRRNPSVLSSLYTYGGA